MKSLCPGTALNRPAWSGETHSRMAWSGEMHSHMAWSGETRIPAWPGQEKHAFPHGLVRRNMHSLCVTHATCTSDKSARQQEPQRSHDWPHRLLSVTTAEARRTRLLPVAAYDGSSPAVRLELCACPVASDSSRPCGPSPRQAPLSVGFPRQEHWSGLGHSLLQGIFPTQGPCRAGNPLPLSRLGSPMSYTRESHRIHTDSVFLPVFPRHCQGRSLLRVFSQNMHPQECRDVKHKVWRFRMLGSLLVDGLEPF